MTQTVGLAAAQTAANFDFTTTNPTVLQMFPNPGTAKIPQAITIPVYTLVNGVEVLLGGLHILQDRGRMTIGANVLGRIKRPDISAYGVDVGVMIDQ